MSKKLIKGGKMLKNKIFWVLFILALAIGTVFGTKLLSGAFTGFAGLGGSSFTENEGVVVLTATSSVFNQGKDPILRTNYYSQESGALRNVRYVKPDLTGFSYDDPENTRACFELTYYDKNKRVIRIEPQTLCIGVNDHRFVIEALKVVPLNQGDEGSALITAPMVPV